MRGAASPRALSIALMSMLSDDLASIFADDSLTALAKFGTPQITARGFLKTEDIPEPDGQGGVIIARRTTFLMSKTDAASVVSGTVLVIDDDTYTVHGQPQNAGRFKTKLILAEGS